MTLETRPRARSGLDGGAAAAIAHAQKASPAFASILAGVDAGIHHQPRGAGRCRSHASTSCWSASRLAARTSVFGGFSALGFGPACRACLPARAPSTSPKARGRDYWRMARAIHAAGFRPGELIHNSFSYHFVPAGS
jgi:phenylacetate-CoA ligase